MTLDELLDGDEDTVSEWLGDHDLIHTCDCGYTVYDPDAVSEAVQEECGDADCDEIYEWACDLSNRYGWMFLESSRPERDIYHCQYCAESELSLFLELTSSSSGNDEEDNTNIAPGETPKPDIASKERLVIYVDESYSENSHEEGGLA